MLTRNSYAHIKSEVRSQLTARQHPTNPINNRQALIYPTRQHFDNKLSSIDHIDKSIHQLLALVKGKDTARDHKYRVNCDQVVKNNSTHLDSFNYEQYRKRIIDLQKLQQIGEGIEKPVTNNNLIGNYQHRAQAKIGACMGRDTALEIKNILNMNYSLHQFQRTKLPYRTPRLAQKQRLNLKYNNKSIHKTNYENDSNMRPSMTPKRKKNDQNMEQTAAKTTIPKNIKTIYSENQNRSILSQNFKGIQEQSSDFSRSLEQSHKSRDNKRKQLHINIQEIQKNQQNSNKIVQSSYSLKKSQQRIPYSPKQALNQSKLQIKFDQEDNGEINPYRRSFQIKVYPCNLNKDNIKNFIADRFMGVVKLDNQFAQLKEIYLQGNLKEISLSEGENKRQLLKVLWSRGMMVNQRQVDQFLDLVPSGKQVNLQLKQQMKDFPSFLQAFVDKYLEAEFEWEKRVVSMITRSQLNSCLFKPSQIDLQSKGYLKMQDLACFINLYGQDSPCFRNKQVQALFLRFCRGDERNGKLSYDKFMRVVCSNI